MELVETLEIDGEEREIADAVARGQIEGINSNLDGLGYGENAGGKNLIDISKITDNSYVQSSDGMFLTHSNVCRTDYIEVKEGQSVYFSGMKKPNIGNTGAMYDENKNYVGAINNYSDVQPLVIPQGVKYIVLSIWKSLFDDFTKAQLEEGIYKTEYKQYIPSVKMLAEEVDNVKNDLSKQCKKDDITTNETIIGTFNGKNYYRRLFTGIGASGSSITVNVGEKIEIYNYYGRAYTYGQSGASDVKYPIPNNNYYIDSQNASETSFQLTIPTSSDTRKVDLVIEYTKVDE